MLGEIWNSLRVGRDHHQEQRLLPVVNIDGKLAGVVTRSDLNQRVEQNGDTALGRPLGDLVRASAVEAYPDEPLRVVVYRMVEKGCTRMPVVERSARKFLALVSLNDLLKARSRHLEEESHRERSLKFRFFLPERQLKKIP
jgi:CBS domain-containing protein